MYLFFIPITTAAKIAPKLFAYTSIISDDLYVVTVPWSTSITIPKIIDITTALINAFPLLDFKL